jgi:hypothetical protein
MQSAGRDVYAGFQRHQKRRLDRRLGFNCLFVPRASRNSSNSRPVQAMLPISNLPKMSAVCDKLHVPAGWRETPTPHRFATAARRIERQRRGYQPVNSQET